MFAVPGWSVSSNSLKQETLVPNSSKDGTKSKKRKRPNKSGKDEAVTSENVSSLWETVVEGRPSSNSENPSKKSKKQHKQQVEQKPDNKIHDSSIPKDPTGDEIQNGERKEKKNKKMKKDKEAKGSPKAAEPTKEANTTTTTTTVKKNADLPPAPPKLTPLQAAMRDKLISARFRHLNETLYTRPSKESFDLFHESPEMFSEYHEGFRQQVKVWPENPVDSFLEDIRARGKIRQPSRGKSTPQPTSLASTPLPRTAGTCTIADLGCGDAQLAQSLQANKAKLHIDIKSFDLQSPIPLVTKADIANLPLQEGDINIAIFCLALMGTNWIDFIEEAYRVLHWKGELWIAEIKSRFAPARSKNAVVEHSVGNRKKLGKQPAKAKPTNGSASHDNDLAVEVDGADDRRRETDVSSFVEALKARGFVLSGDRNEGIDLSNKMFVKMRFIKAASPTKGKGAAEERKGKGKKQSFAPKIEQEDEWKDNVNEAAILKPCVYKLR